MSGDTDNGLLPWALAGVGGVVSTLLTGLVWLFRLRESENAKAIAEMKDVHAKAIAELKAAHEVAQAKSDKCEEDRSQLFARCEVLEVKLAHVEQKVSKMDLDGTQYSHRRDA